MQQNQFFRVEDFIGNNAFLVDAATTFHHLNQQILNKTTHTKFDIFYHWKVLSPQKYANSTIKEIVDEDPASEPVFYICDIFQGNHCEITNKYAKWLTEHYNTEEKKIASIGENGHVIYDDRNLALMASSVHYATQQKAYQVESEEIKKQFSSSIINEIEEPQQKDQPGFFKRILMKLGIIRSQPKSVNLLRTIHQLKKVNSKETLKEHINREFSDYDIHFATYLEAVYLKFAVFSGFRIHYLDYGNNLNFSVIKRQFSPKAKIGIIGDFGTGLQDSIKLLQHLILTQNVDIILHLGDVYYAGTPHQYEANVMKPLKQFRLKSKKEVFFYSIPGNHDYYSWGLPFLCFLKEVNEDKFTKQEASYFCLRSQDDKWQFLGLDTAYNDASPVDQVNGFAVGPSLQSKQLIWAKDKLQNFKGSTILLTHHQLFSIHERICGSITKYRHFSCVNPLLSAQLFEHLPSISAWFWGHEHSFMLFQDNILGVPKCRLLGNSSFHVFSQQKPYQRKQGFPVIPFIEDDQNYRKKYRPLTPGKTETDEPFYNLCYALIDFEKTKKEEHLQINYYCCPCFEPGMKNMFQPYVIYKQDILSKNQLQKRRKPVQSGEMLFMKTQVGLLVSGKGFLDLAGCQIKIEKVQTQEEKNIKNMENILLKAEKQIEILDGIWKIMLLENKKSEILCHGDAFYLLHEKKGCYLGCSATMEGPQLVLSQKTSLFMFLEDSLIKI